MKTFGSRDLRKRKTRSDKGSGKKRTNYNRIKRLGNKDSILLWAWEIKPMNYEAYLRFNRNIRHKMKPEVYIPLRNMIVRVPTSEINTQETIKHLKDVCRKEDLIDDKIRILENNANFNFWLLFIGFTLSILLILVTCWSIQSQINDLSKRVCHNETIRETLKCLPDYLNNTRDIEATIGFCNNRCIKESIYNDNIDNSVVMGYNEYLKCYWGCVKNECQVKSTKEVCEVK